MEKIKRISIGSWLLIMLTAGVLLGWGMWQYLWPKQYAVELRVDGFYPSTLSVPVGSTIVFVNRTDRAFWPASNFHPSHKLYTDFDAKQPLAPGARWSFEFHESGIWRYHDHLNSQQGGTIVVRSSPFDKRESPCDVSSEQMPIKIQERCWIQQIESVLEDSGIDRAFATFSDLYENKAAFSSDCHDVTHLLGEAAFREYVDSGKVIESTKTSYCGYGFYHGFIEGLLFTTGNFEQAKNYCKEVQKNLSKHIVSPNAIYSCYHGIGHGTFDTQSFAQWGNDSGMLDSALRTCEKVTVADEPELQKQCATGVFNALANAYSNHTYNLSFDPVDPWGICQRQQVVEYKKACFREVAASYVKMMTPDYAKGIQVIGAMSDSVGAEATMYAYMSEATRLNLDTTSSEFWATLCENVANFPLRISCVEGVATGLFLWGKPGHEHEQSLDFCSLPELSGESKSACFAYVLPRLRTVYDQSKVALICQTIDPQYKKYCL
jgi:hypothetical protein